MNSTNVKITNRKSLSILTWNARSIKDKINELEIILKENKVDIACIQETLANREKNYKLLQIREKRQNKSWRQVPEQSPNYCQ